MLKRKLTKVEFTNLEKILYPKAKVTKLQVIEHYIRFAPRMLPILVDRPMVLTRYPDGADREGFYEKDAPQGTPKWVKKISIYSKKPDREVNYILCNDLDTLVWLANLAAIEIHMPLSRTDSLEKPDFAFIDIDPEPPATFHDASSVALLVKEKLDLLDLKGYVKTSGKKGLHILIPILRKYTFRYTRNFVHALGIQIAKESPKVVSEFKDTKKPGKVFIDYTQNSQGRTMVCPYGLRATSEATVSTPLGWSELKKDIKPGDFTILTVPGRIKRDPWKDILKNRQKLEV